MNDFEKYAIKHRALAVYPLIKLLPLMGVIFHQPLLRKGN